MVIPSCVLPGEITKKMTHALGMGYFLLANKYTRRHQNKLSFTTFNINFIDPPVTNIEIMSSHDIIHSGG